MKADFDIKGMTCAACQARVERATKKVAGVEEANVSLLTNSMTVTGEFNEKDIVKAVKDAGYGAKLQKPSKDGDAPVDRLGDFRVLRLRFIISAVLLIPLMYISMGHHMFGWPLPQFLMTPTAMGIAEAVLALAVIVVNFKFFKSGTLGVLHGSPNMDTLVALGSGISFGYSIYLVIAGWNQPEMADLYFESAAMILVLITLGKMLEAYSKSKTTGAIDSLRKLKPSTATVLRDGKETAIPVGDVKVGDLFVVRPGEAFPTDGLIREGHSSVNESMLTGESVPVDKEVGSEVSQGTLNVDGFLTCEVTKVGGDTMLESIIRMVTESASSKAPIQKIADKIAGIFVPVVIGIAILTFAIWMIVTGQFKDSLMHAISVLVVSCPCAMGLATPVAVMVGSGVGARLGILFKNAAVLEATGKVKEIVMDKTGTITKGEPEVTDIVTMVGESTEELFRVSFALESKSSHPLAKAVTAYLAGRSSENRLVSSTVLEEASASLTDFVSETGFGLAGTMDGVSVHAGKASYIETFAEIPEFYLLQAEALAKKGKTPLYFEKGGHISGLIAVADVLKDDATKAVRTMKTLDLHPVLLSGDKKETVEYIGRLAGIEDVISGVLPGEKADVIKKRASKGHFTMMVGDGINDAPALTSASVGVAIGAGTDVAIDAADIILMNSKVYDIVRAIRLSRATYRTIKQNLFWAFIYNVLMIPIAAGAFAFLGLQINPMISAAAMSLSSVSVVLNALRLNLVEKKL